MDTLTVLEAVDNGWAVAALIVLAVFAWSMKYGKELLSVVKATDTKIDELDARQARQKEEEPDAGADG
jgi:hypothetical protein